MSLECTGIGYVLNGVCLLNLKFYIAGMGHRLYIVCLLNVYNFLFGCDCYMLSSGHEGAKELGVSMFPIFPIEWRFKELLRVSQPPNMRPGFLSPVCSLVDMKAKEKATQGVHPT